MLRFAFFTLHNTHVFLHAPQNPLRFPQIAWSINMALCAYTTTSASSFKFAWWQLSVTNAFKQALSSYLAWGGMNIPKNLVRQTTLLVPKVLLSLHILMWCIPSALCTLSLSTLFTTLLYHCLGNFHSFITCLWISWYLSWAWWTFSVLSDMDDLNCTLNPTTLSLVGTESAEPQTAFTPLAHLPVHLTAEGFHPGSTSYQWPPRMSHPSARPLQGSPEGIT